MRYYIGIDGGGTKTQYALFDENKRMISTVKTDGSNHENLEGAIPEAAGIIMKGINDLLLQNCLMQENVTHVLMALAGMDHPWQEEEMASELKKAGLIIPATICNDGFIVVKAGIRGKAGIGYNCGTGTCCNSVGSDGKLLQIGGFGQLSGDVGGGRWIAYEVFRLAYFEVCLKAQKSACTAGFCEKAGVEPTRAGLLSVVPRLEVYEDKLVRDLIDVFFDAVNAGDEAALDVVDVMAENGAKFIAGHVKNQKFDGDVIDVVLSGAIHTKLPSEVYIEKLMVRAEELGGRKLNCIKLTVPPVTGCINWMLEE